MHKTLVANFSPPVGAKTSGAVANTSGIGGGTGHPTSGAAGNAAGTGQTPSGSGTGGSASSTSASTGAASSSAGAGKEQPVGEPIRFLQCPSLVNGLLPKEAVPAAGASTSAQGQLEYRVP
jgi:hypothetical protein